MAKYRKKPLVVDAVQFDPCGAHRLELPEGVGGLPSAGADNWGYEGCVFWVETLEGRHTCVSGDWIITGVTGEHYPCKPNVFALTYEYVGPDCEECEYGIPHRCRGGPPELDRGA